MSDGGLSGVIDVRGLLARDPRGGPGRRVTLSEKQGLVVHYNGPPVPDSLGDMDLLAADARYHVGRDWDENPWNGDALTGNGLMYHLAIGRDGRVYWCRDVEDVLWHCGAWPQNATALSVLVILGGEQRATPAQLGALSVVCNAWHDLGHLPPGSDVWGHQELSPTSCPGTLMADFVLPWRRGWGLDPGTIDIGKGGGGMATGQWFAETGHYIGGGFWNYWQTHGGLMQFGYPLTDELEEDGRVVQYFERAVFEWWPENEAHYQVLLRRLGAEALSRRVANEAAAG